MRTVLLAIAGALVLIAGGLHFARGQGHAENHDWYQHLQNRMGYSCCNDKDGRPAAVWRDANGEVWTKLGGRTVRVPPDRVLDDKLNLRPLTGHIFEQDGYIRCALVGGAGG